MDKRQNKLKKPKALDTQDRISDLPDVLLTHILSFVPTVEAVRTSVLSTRWKPLWADVPVLDLKDSQFTPKGFNLMDRKERKANFVTFVHRFLMRNNGSPVWIQLNCRECYDLSLIESWICAVQSPHLEKLLLNICIHLLPTSGLSSQNRWWYLSLCYKHLDTLLPQNTSLPTGKIRIQGEYFEDPSVLDSLFSLFKEWNIVELEFEGDKKSYWHKTYDFPQRLITWEMLAVLELLQFVDLDFRKDEICFPNLKVLCLEYNYFKYHDSASNLISFSCPVLEEMYITGSDWDHLQPLVITSHTLKRLNICFGKHYTDCAFEILINVPALEYLDLLDRGFNKYVLEDVGSLIEAKVSVKSGGGELLREFQNVKKLSLHEDTWDRMESIDLPAYHHLTRLEFYSGRYYTYNMNWIFLLEFLHKSPMLEDLFFQGVKFVVGEEFDLTSEQDVPHCLLSSLKTCEFDQLYGKENVVEVIGYFLMNSKVLKRMSISSSHAKHVNKRAILALGRGSSACEIYYRSI